MALWGWVAGAYGAFLALTAIAPTSVSRRAVLFTACLAYSGAAIAAASLPHFWIQLLVPAALLLTGYWLSGLFFTTPQPWLERWLAAIDRASFERFNVNRLLDAAPLWFLELLEAAYVADYAVVAAGAIIGAAAGGEHISRYWSIVLAAELACYAALPYLRSRPPRVIEPAGVIEMRRPRLRRLNTAILDRASVHANTVPSGHVAGAVAAALATFSVSVLAGVVLMVCAVLITVSAIVGRYHYTVDCALGAAVGAIAAWLV
jgi:hypothetical protein